VQHGHLVGRRLAGAVAFVLVALVAASSCGGGGGGGGGGGENTTIEGFLGLEGDGMLQRQGQAENHVQRCMTSQGFQYVAADPVAQQRELLGGEGTLDDEEFQQQYGYGITTLFEKREQQRQTTNDRFRDGLDEAGRVAYDRALFGDDPTATLPEALDSGDFSRLGGCTKEAADKVFGGVEVIQSLQEKLDELDARILEDSRMVTAVSKWSECMADAGYDLGAQDDVDAFLQSQLEAIVGPPEEPKEDYDRAALQRLQREEVKLVGIDVECEDKHISKAEEKVRPEYERTFRDQNASLLSKVPSL
jgi:hypothetical protein